MEHSIFIGDGSGFVDSDAAQDSVFYLNSVMYFMVQFNSPLPPASVDLTQMSITQTDDVCGTDCLNVVEFVCDSCGDDGISKGPVYNFSIVLTSSIFEASAGRDTPTTFELSFGFQYARRRLSKLVDVFKVPVSFSLRDYDCHSPNALHSAVETVNCDVATMTKMMICSTDGWKDVSECTSTAATISLKMTTFVGLMASTIFVVAFLSRCFMVSKDSIKYESVALDP